MNKIFIIGRLCKDVELKVTESGREFANFSVAVDRRFKNKDGESEKHTDFFDCTAWGRSGVFVNQYFKKGDGITIEGRMESRKYTDKDGNNRTFWGVTCENVEFPVGGRRGDSATATADAAESFAPADGEDDGELPF